ncbi:hypothetical protein F0562_021769 [Nyssa sinensis]|uniref:J domain-containing protein n=1 Tax=Nyssa sinensis TaxID=561372 RepID=A0A5J5BMZ7_9ASTE|nr:hypothetical protein F0562_021769 [Nyssa sinensis]
MDIDDLLAACENLDSASPGPTNDEKHVDNTKNESSRAKFNEVSNGERTHTEEQVQLIKQINRSKDYYAVLGVEKSCSVEEIRRAYRKLSLKVHPDKNKAIGSEEAYKKVSKAFKCLNDDDSRRQYDQMEPDYSLQKNYSYQFPKITEKHGVEFYVKSPEFDQNFPLGNSARVDVDNNVIRDYKNMLGRYCHIELQRRQWSRTSDPLVKCLQYLKLQILAHSDPLDLIYYNLLKKFDIICYTDPSTVTCEEGSHKNKNLHHK